MTTETERRILDHIYSCHRLPTGCSGIGWDVVRENIERLNGRRNRDGDWSEVDDRIQDEAARVMPRLVSTALREYLDQLFAA